MEENKSGLLKFALTYGLIIGLTLVVYAVILYIADIYFNKALGYVQYVILIVGIVMAVIAFRDKAQGGYISYGRALGYSVLVTMFAGIVSVLFNFIMINYIDQGLIDKYMAVVEETLQNSRFIPEDQIDLALDKSRSSITALWTLPVGVAGFTFVGFIISLVTSAILKKEPNPVA